MRPTQYGGDAGYVPARHGASTYICLCAIQYETKRDFSKPQHSKQNKRFLATETALNTNETSKYTYELLLTSADRLLLSKTISLHCLLLALEHTFLFITTNGQASADTDKRRDTVLLQLLICTLACKLVS